MKTVQKLSLLAMAIVIAGCNEKVSPELQQSNTVAPGDGSAPTIVPPEYYFKLTNTSRNILNYKLHKTGSGNMSSKCEVRSTTKLDNDTFRGNPVANDITCYLEAEELSLRGGGFSWEIEASPNTCEFVSYAPFSYYNMMPGTSSGSYTAVVCTTDETNQTHIDRLNPGSPGWDADDFITYDTGGGVYANASCDTVLSENTALAGNGVAGTVPRIRQPFPLPESIQDLCMYDYSKSGGPNCDEGVINYREYQVTFDASKADQAGNDAKEAAVAAYTANYSDAVDSGDGIDDAQTTISPAENAEIVAQGNAAYAAAYAAWAPTAKSVFRTHYCNGTAAACIAGPYTKHNIGGTNGSVISETKFDEKFTNKFEYASLLGTGVGNYHYANYRRDLANSQIAYGTSEKPHNAIYQGAWSNLAFGKTFEPNLLERYSRNLNHNQTSMIPTGLNFTDGINTIRERHLSLQNRYNARPLAADPFVGLGSDYYTNPYYTFYCLDTAFDIKARIRVVVRDWDRIFPTGSNLELLSDMFLGIDARQDLQNYVEDPDSEDDYNNFNDLADWDDIINMERFIAGGVLIYRPLPDGSYPDGYFNPGQFPNASVGDQ